jgi:transketolase
MLTYIDILFRYEFIKPYRDKIILGKPFGSQAYYLLWKELGYLDSIEDLSAGVKHDEIDFVDYGEETMGNALGVAAGIAMTTSKKVWVNLTDATLQMGSTLEAIQFIGHRRLTNIVVTVDYNDMQVTGKTSDIIPVDPVIRFLKDNRWRVELVDGHDGKQLRQDFRSMDTKWVHECDHRPIAYICKTIKGYGVPYMEQDPVNWHYKKLDESYTR